MAKTRRTRKTKKTISIAAVVVLAVLWVAGNAAAYTLRTGSFPTIDQLLGQLGLSDARPVSGSIPTEASLHFIDVGQGDSTLILSDGHACLVDAGEVDQGQTVVNYLNAVGVDKLDYLVMTHPHSDHIGGMQKVLEQMEVDTVLLPDFTPAPTPTTSVFERTLNAIDQNGAEAVTAQAGQIYPLGQGEFKVLGAGIETDDYNNLSLVLRFDLPGVSLLCSGDAEAEVERELLSEGAWLGADVFQAGHHGSSTSNSPEFVQAISPRYMVVSCGQDNSYGHPHAETLQTARQVGAEVLRTDELGSIVIYPEGSALTVETTAEGDAAA